MIHTFVSYLSMLCETHLAFLCHTQGATWVCCVVWHFPPTPKVQHEYVVWNIHGIYHTHTRNMIYLLYLLTIFYTYNITPIINLAQNQSPNMVALWLYKCGVPLFSLEKYHYCTGTHTKDVKTNKIIKSLLGSSLPHPTWWLCGYINVE